MIVAHTSSQANHLTLTREGSLMSNIGNKANENMQINYALPKLTLLHKSILCHNSSAGETGATSVRKSFLKTRSWEGKKIFGQILNYLQMTKMFINKGSEHSNLTINKPRLFTLHICIPKFLSINWSNATSSKPSFHLWCTVHAAYMTRNPRTREDAMQFMTGLKQHQVRLNTRKRKPRASKRT